MLEPMSPGMDATDEVQDSTLARSFAMRFSALEPSDIQEFTARVRERLSADAVEFATLAQRLEDVDYRAQPVLVSPILETVRFNSHRLAGVAGMFGLEDIQASAQSLAEQIRSTSPNVSAVRTGLAQLRGLLVLTQV